MIRLTFYFKYINAVGGLSCTRVKPMAFFCFKIGSGQPTSSNSDFIENKTTAGGGSKKLSTLQSLLSFFTDKFMQCLTSNIRPHIGMIEAVKFNIKEICIDTYGMYVRELIG